MVMEKLALLKLTAKVITWFFCYNKQDLRGEEKKLAHVPCILNSFYLARLGRAVASQPHNVSKGWAAKLALNRELDFSEVQDLENLVFKFSSV